ncbi:KAT8 regulatory NSL complex subunit 3, partial [Teleopsis dalmanni]|uniref:KAT8 regulatory NSL complex subunit 3 n=1 Tax=Teleopsis dalmanni TaxID=139649 RepID=UPI0018CF7F46
MSSYIKLFEDFLQQKENDVKSRAGSQEEEIEENPTENMQPVPSSAPCVEAKMEHSYTRDAARTIPELTTGLSAARTILVRRPPQCPSCHTHPLDEHDFNDGSQVEVPGFHEIPAKEAMNECARVASYVQNNNKDDEDWEPYVNQTGWTFTQKTLFKRVALILDNDQLGRLANANIPNEPMQRRVLIDKSSSSMRKLLASISWEARLIQWLHAVLMEHLPTSYMASYLDILQTLHQKLPTLVDKMIFGRPISMAKELMAPVLKKKWEPMVINIERKLNHNAVIVTVPTITSNGVVPKRIQKWYDYLGTIAEIVHITLPVMNDIIKRDPLEQLAEKVVSLTRVKIQDLRSDNSARSIILIGFNAGSALALQVAMSENIACVICMGFAFHTLNGVRGMPDDRILDIKVPILFVIGQNSAKTSTEEMEHLREKLQSESAVVVVGSADDSLRVPKIRRKIENVTQATVDSMIVKEMYDFVNKTLNNRPGPRQPTPIGIATTLKGKVSNGENSGTKVNTGQRKRKAEPIDDDEKLAQLKTKYGVKSLKRSRKTRLAKSRIDKSTTDPMLPKRRGRPRTKALNPGQKVNKSVSASKLQAQQTQQASSQASPNSTINDDLSAAMQTILSETNDGDFVTNTNNTTGPKAMTSFDIVAQPKSGTGGNPQ